MKRRTFDFNDYWRREGREMEGNAKGWYTRVTSVCCFGLAVSSFLLVVTIASTAPPPSYITYSIVLNHHHHWQYSYYTTIII